MALAIVFFFTAFMDFMAFLAFIAHFAFIPFFKAFKAFMVCMAFLALFAIVGRCKRRSKDRVDNACAEMATESNCVHTHKSSIEEPI
jgi:hypothetical protein